MKAIKKDVNKRLIAGILFSCMLAAGVPMIIFGAVNRIWAVMASGIVFVCLGFYGTPVVWVSYANKKSLERVVYAVEKEGIFTVQGIAAQLSFGENQVRAALNECFRKKYLEGYIRQGDVLSPNTTQREEKLRAAVCASCGAKFTYRGAVAVCPYCGAANKGE